MDDRKITLPESVSFIIDRLNSRGFRADIVGGPVRDHLRGKLPEDYDVTTNALPEEVEEVFSDIRVIETGIKHGTVTLLIDGVGYEVTTYRIDGEYKDNRRPESVEFTSDIREDLARRDFTMNAIAYNPTDGITDPFFGEEDIKRGVIRAVGDPALRFSEDALRILRGIRFSAALGFEIEEATHRALVDKKELLRNVSAERIYTEWKKLISGRYALGVFDNYREVIGVFLPEIKDSPLPEAGAFLSAEPLVRMLSLFALSGTTGEEYFHAMKRLRTDSRTAENGRCALENLGKFDLTATGGLGRLLYLVGEEKAALTVKLSLLLKIADQTAPGRLSDYLEERRPYRLKDLMISGDDLVAIGVRGKEIGRILDELLLRVIDGEAENQKETLLDLAAKLISENN